MIALDPPGSPARGELPGSDRPPLDRIDIRRILESEGLRVLRSETACTPEGDLHVMLAVRVP